jgi:hypothetical protein
MGALISEVHRGVVHAPMSDASSGQKSGFGAVSSYLGTWPTYNRTLTSARYSQLGGQAR